MAFVIQLREGSADPINLFYLADDGWSMLEKGLQPNDPERHELWGGQLENVLVRQQDGRREIPLRFQGEWSTVDDMIDAVNALEKRLRHAARYCTDGWGDQVMLRVQLHNASYPVDFPVSSGSIDKNDLMNACSMLMDATGHREAKRLASVGVTIVCGEPYWEATETYYLDNLVYNPGFWRGAVAPGDSWTEVDPAAALTLAWEATIIQFMGRSLKWTIAADAVNDVGIRSDNVAVSASTSYYVEGRGFHTAGCDRITAIVYDVTGGAPIGGAVWYWDNQDDDWEKIGGSFTTPVGCANVRIDVYRDNADSTAGNKTFYCDGFYLGLGRRGDGLQGPLGWMSGGNLVNHLDDGADHINVICVAEIPGEMPAETRFDVQMGAHNAQYLHIAKRTRDDPHNVIWQLLPCDAYTTAEGGVGGACAPGLIDANCKDSDKIVDANSPSGSRIEVNFATDQTMALRAYWDIISNLPSYYGRWMLGVLCDVSGTTDEITMKIFAYDVIQNWGQGFVIEQVVPNATANDWRLLSGWQVLSFPVGTHDDDQFGAGNRWRIQIYADTNSGTPTDSLYIAGAHLFALDEGYFIGGDPTFGNSMRFRIQELDGDKGVFPYDAGTGRHYSNTGSAGPYPKLTPEVENWFYFLLSHYDNHNIAHSMAVSARYLPQGIFLRGSNP